MRELTSESVYRPFLVSKDEDSMCFAVTSFEVLPKNATELLDFSFNIPSIVKVQSSIYDYIGNQDALMQPEFSISFLMNFTNANNSINAGSVEKIYRAAQTLQNYEVQVLNSFFWTSKATQDFYQRNTTANDIATLQDEIKAKEWYVAAENLKSLVAIAPNKTINTNDPCNFKKLLIDNREVSRKY